MAENGIVRNGASLTQQVRALCKRLLNSRNFSHDPPSVCFYFLCFFHFGARWCGRFRSIHFVAQAENLFFGMLKNQYGISTICFLDIFHISCSFISQQIELTDSTMCTCTCIFCILHTVGHRLWFPYGLNVYTTNKKFEITASLLLFTPFNDCNANKYCLKFNIHHLWNKFRQKRWTMFSALCVYENWFCANIVLGCFGKVFG